ncbi:MAG: hypothetical protein J6C44_03225 [Muribaculaceae bacterium]|nr:hypothetical protein [Muribaculaceae bacterium]
MNRKQISLLSISVPVLTLLLTSCETTEPAGGGGDDEQGPRLLSVKVLDYSPAPGQFVNEIPLYQDGDTRETIRAKVEKAMNSGEMVTLGAFGGSITVKLKAPVYASHDGSPELRILGNAFLYTPETAANPIGSAEPGIVMVMTDANGNGEPDDTWYVLKGDHFDQAVYTSITYTDNSSAGDDKKFVKWEDSQGNSGWLSHNVAYHNHGFFPQWELERTVTVEGLRLPDNGVYNEKTGNYDLSVYSGYADCWPNNSSRSGLSLSSAVTLEGQPVRVTRVDFIKVYTGILQNNGPLGECSTEVAGFQSL